MTQLAPNLFQRRFQDLMEIGRAQIPALAPGWTDHNAHDPGITLMELLAWVAEAQLYSLSHVRRDERTAYAALLGISASGTRSATGLIWSDRKDQQSPAATFRKTQVIPEDAPIYLANTDNPIFTPVHSLLWVPGRIDKLETRDPRGRKTDYTNANERDGTPFLPFGEKAGPRAVLAMKFVCRDKAGMFGEDRQNAKNAYWPIGVRAASTTTGGSTGSSPTVREGKTESEPATKSKRSPLVATLIANDERVQLKIASDTTQGFLTTGVVLLDLDNVSKSHTEFTVEFRRPSGFPRPPRIVRIEPNVIPIQQGRTIDQEIHVANGNPDLNFALDVPGLKFASGEEPVKVEIQEGGLRKTWNRCVRLSEQGPDARAYEFDLRTDELTFGNGVNGQIPPAKSQILLTYKVSDGEGGGVARNRKWRVTGFDRTFGVNTDPIAGGTAASDFRQQRRDARARSRSEHALVSSKDIETAATDLSLLEVARVWVVEPDDRAPRTGVVTLVAMRTRPDDKEPDEPPETPRWLAAIRRMLVARMPLGMRLIVAAPHYRDFTIQAVVEAHQGLNPDTVKKAIETELKKRLAIVGPTPRQPGVPVTKRDVAAWLRGVAGVKRVLQLQLQYVNEKTADIRMPRSGSPLPPMPMGIHLIVKAQDYRDFTIEAVIKNYPARNRDRIKKAVEGELKRRLAIVKSTSHQSEAPPTKREVAEWILGVDGVRCVLALQVRYTTAKSIDVIKVIRSGLPRWRDRDNTIEVRRPEPGRSQ